jgi:hypothetical protein
VTRAPQRLPEPVLSSARFGTTQPYVGIVRDPEGGRLRLWYNRGNQVWYSESGDGIAWGEPRLAWDLKRCYGVSVVDDRGRDPDPTRRFKLANWQATREKEDRPGDDSGVWVGFSPDGFRWTSYPGNPVLPTWPEGWGKPVHHGAGDIVDAFFDPIRRRYGCALKVHAIPGDGFPKGPRASDLYLRRWVGMSVSDDFEHWRKPWTIALADPHDEGLTEFYGMAGVHARGPLLIGFIRVLRDDLPCDPGGPANGVGDTVLATSRDGVTWERHRQPFLARNPVPGSWDHAMAWASGAVAVGDELFLYYGGYARGHKIAPEKERQIGLARLPRDRYAARRAGAAGGRLRTPIFTLPPGQLLINADAARGELRARLLDTNNQVIPGFDTPDHPPLRASSLAAPVQWKGNLEALRGKPVGLEFVLREADLFAFSFGA